MSLPRNPLITGVTHDPLNRSDSMVPSSLALSEYMSGQKLTANENANNLTDCGTYCFHNVNATNNNFPDHLSTASGILTVMLYRDGGVTPGTFGGETTTVSDPTAIRQIVWPDGPTDITPYTRTKVNGVWGEWQVMGGGNLRRVKLTANTTARKNTLYYSFGDYTLTLPDPNECQIGTKVCLEQYAKGQNGGKVVCTYGNPATTYEVVTSPAHGIDVVLNGGTRTEVEVVRGPHVYMFEVVEGDNNGTKDWFLDVDNDYAQTFSSLRDEIDTEVLARTNAIADEQSTRSSEITTERNARIDKDNDLENADKDFRKAKKYYEVLTANPHFIVSNTIEDMVEGPYSSRDKKMSAMLLMQYVHPVFVIKNAELNAIIIPNAGIIGSWSSVCEKGEFTIQIPADITQEITIRELDSNDYIRVKNTTGKVLEIPFSLMRTHYDGNTGYEHAWAVDVIS